jgi:hypothetical protein
VFEGSDGEDAVGGSGPTAPCSLLDSPAAEVICAASSRSRDTVVFAANSGFVFVYVLLAT